jgi:hypothetical protein
MVRRMPLNNDAACVLVYGLDPMLVETRAKVIHTGGFCTCEAVSASQLSERLNRARCSALILCHSLSEEESGRASQLAKRKIPGIKVIAMSAQRSQSAPAFYDESLVGFVGPEELLSAVKRAIHP